ERVLRLPRISLPSNFRNRMLSVRHVRVLFCLFARLPRLFPGRPPQFPASSLLDPAAGKILSLPAPAGNLAQRINFTINFGPPSRFRGRNKKLPCCFPIGREKR